MAGPFASHHSTYRQMTFWLFVAAAFVSLQSAVQYAEAEALRIVPFSAVQVAARVGPQFSGQQLGGRSVEPDVSEEVDISNAPSCDFFTQNLGSCVPDAVYSPCRHCKASTNFMPNFLGGATVNCPGQDAFDPNIQHLYVWVPKPIYNRNYKMGKQYLCVVTPVSAQQSAVGAGYGNVPALAETQESFSTLTIVLMIMGVIFLMCLGLAVAICACAGGGRRRRRN